MKKIQSQFVKDVLLLEGYKSQPKKIELTAEMKADAAELEKELRKHINPAKIAEKITAELTEGGLI